MILVFGGDGHNERMNLPHVELIEGWDRNALKTSQRIKQGKYTEAYVLTRWMSHPQYQMIKRACSDAAIPMTTWTRGMGELHRELREKAPVEQGKKIANEMVKVLEEKLEVKQEIKEEALVSNQDFRKRFESTDPETLRTAMTVDPQHVWTTPELAEFTNLTARQYNVVKIVSRWIKEGHLEVVGGKKFSQKDPIRFRLVRNQSTNASPVTVNGAPTTQVKYVNAPTPKKDTGLFLFCEGKLIPVSKENLTEEIQKYPGAKLLREVKVKISMGIVE